MRKEFPEVTRQDLLQKFITAWGEVHPSGLPEAAEYEGDVFLGCLESIASTLTQGGEATSEQRRKEKLRAVVNATDNLLDAVSKVDDLALGGALFSGLQEVAEHVESGGAMTEAFASLLETGLATGVYAPSYRAIMYGRRMSGQEGESAPLVSNLSSYHMQCIAYDLQKLYAKHLRAFALGLRKSLADVRPMDKGGYSPPYQVAKWLEDHLGRLQIEITTSETGLAGSAFTATLELAGITPPAAGYWLRKAKSDPEAWGAFVKRMQGDE
ncbi:hypothetical protein VLF92_22245 [Pseudomonas chengduensis]